MKTVKLTILGIIFLSIAACGGGSSGESTDNNGNNTGGGTGETELTLVQISPNNGTEGASPVENIVVTFNRALTDSEFAAFNLSLKDELTDVPVLFETSASSGGSSLIINPIIPFSLDTRYVFSIDDESTSFRVVNYAAKKETNYTTSSFDTIKEYTQIDNQPYSLLKSIYNSAGNDGLWQTDDDPINNTWEGALDSNRRLVQDFNFNDQQEFIWGKAWEYDGEGREVFHVVLNSLGNDQAYGTSDDDYQYYIDKTYSDNRATYVYYYDSGFDGIWRTADDVPSSYRVKLTVDDSIFYYYFFDAGVDSILGNEDDNFWYGYMNNTNESRILTVGTNSLGGDNVAFTEDDFDNSNIYFYSIYPLQNGLRVGTGYQYDEPGLDGIWQNQDDQPSWKTLYSRNNELQLEQRMVTYAGADNIIDTQDDRLVLQLDYEYDQSGHMISSTEIYPAYSRNLITEYEQVLFERVSSKNASPKELISSNESVMDFDLRELLKK